MSSTADSHQLHRLPTLFEVLHRRTLPPVDLFAFYIFMRDQQRSVEYLDFWLDVAQHLSLCRLYVRQLRRSILDTTRQGSPQSSGKLSSAVSEVSKSHEKDKVVHEPEIESRRLSQILRAESVTSPDEVFNNNNNSKSHDGRFLNLENRDIRDVSGNSSSESEDFKEGKRLEPAYSPSTTVTRAHIRESAYKIMVTYFVNGAEHELVLPLHIIRAITAAIEVDGRDDPEVFDEARDYVFRAMEREAYPTFLYAKALGNLVPAGAISRLLIGLFSLFAAFWVAFILILLDFKPKVTRLWLILPFSLGVYGCLSHQYGLDPVLALLGYFEITYFKFMKLREPYVKNLIWKRAAWQLIFIFLIIVSLCLLFCLVPGRRI
ncbi:RGS domain-containing protein [Lipomyces japonicus]|uniref:RGS domain-containing protein n=1 Tax=Lipomyces japonicus TaxID=56871 RepID=UPI0034CD02C3